MLADTPADAIPQVLAEIQDGEGLSLSSAGRLFPGSRGNGTLDPSTTFRWVTKGLPTPGGGRVKLEACRVGGRWLTSRAAIARFVTALTPSTNPPPAPPTRKQSARRRESERAATKLKELGA